MGSFLAFCTKDKFVLHWLLYISVYFCVLLFPVSCVFVSMMYKKSCVTLDVDYYAVQG